MDFQNEKKNLFLFFLLTFTISWFFWLPSVLVSFGILPSGPIQILGNLAIFGPFLAAFFLTSVKEGKGEAKKLFLRGWSIKVNKKWVAALFLPLVTAGIAFLIIEIIEPMNRIQYIPPVAMWVPNFILYYFIGGPFTEEYGWRGYTLDRIQSKYDALISSLILGLIWGAWHLPLFFIAGTTQSYIPLYEFILIQGLTSIFYTWIVNNNRDEEGDVNVFLAIMFHAIANFSTMIFPY
ncbi:MAG: CPBP family intramembrane metalloprotease [Candidatus Lokiarchaeota archaeon]|nr:CPBP family intramembrane metalloprotease [Candidatus Lokiarchaeota archaeon]